MLDKFSYSLLVCSLGQLLKRCAICIGILGSLPALAQPSLTIPADVDFEPHAYFSYRSHEVYDELMIIEDKRYDIVDVINDNVAWKTNESRQYLDRHKSYWARLEVNTAQRDTILIEFGAERLNTWGQVQYYLYNNDSLLISGKTGTDLLPAEKQLRNALNLAMLPLPAGKSILYVHLDGHYLITDNPSWNSRYQGISGDISFWLHDPATYCAIEGYKYPGYFTQDRRGHFFGANFFKQCLEIVTDADGDLTIDEVTQAWDANAHYIYDDYPDADSVYWMRFKVIGDDYDARSYLFGLSSGTHWNFDKIQIFSRSQNGTWLEQLSGNKVSRNDKSISTDWNLFKIEVLPRDTQEVFLRLDGAGKRFIPEFSMVHFDEPNFWSRIFTIQSIYGAFYGILIVQSFYFLILGFLEKEWLHIWFVVLIIGFGLSLGFVGGDVNYFLFPAISDWHPYIAGLGGFLIVLGLFRYLIRFLQPSKILGVAVSSILNLLLVIHFIICVYFAISLYSIGGSIAVFEMYFQVFFGSIILNFLVALFIGIRSLIEGNRHAPYFVGAFVVLILVLVVRLFFAFSSFDSGQGFDQETISAGLYVHYLLFLGVILTIILLGFTNGFRIGQLKIEASNSLLKLQQEEEINALLLEKNKVIEERVEENQLLVKEIHHRVKNNLQVLASLLSLQSEYIKDPIAYEAVIKGKSRVDAIGLVHQMLYLRDENRSSIDMSMYLEELRLYLEDSLVIFDTSVMIVCESSIDHLDLDTAIPLGLTITELITNSYKHGLSDRSDGRVDVKLWIDEDQLLCLKVSDNSEVSEDDAPQVSPKSFGKELIRLLTKKLKGEIVVDTTDGYSTTIRYKKYKHYKAEQ